MSPVTVGQYDTSCIRRVSATAIMLARRYISWASKANSRSFGVFLRSALGRAMRRAGCPPRLGIRRSLIVRGVSPHLRHHHFLLMVDKLEGRTARHCDFFATGASHLNRCSKPMPFFLWFRGTVGRRSPSPAESLETISKGPGHYGRGFLIVR